MSFEVENLLFTIDQKSKELINGIKINKKIKERYEEEKLEENLIDIEINLKKIKIESEVTTRLKKYLSEIENEINELDSIIDKKQEILMETYMIDGNP
jgi:DNA polymerase II small subunit/DNA polymerase delta subunit B